MKAFAYHAPASIPDAVAALGATPDSLPLAGGMTLLPTLKNRLADPAALIDLAALPELRGIAVGPGVLTIGAMTRHAEVARSPLVLSSLPVLARLAGSIGDPAVRNRGTLGGSLANNDPSADYPAAVLGLGATIVTTAREIAADAFFVGLFETALEPGELIVAVRCPLPRRAGYAKIRNPASRYATIGVFVAEVGTGPRVAVTGGGGGVTRLPEFEAALATDFSTEAIAGIRLSPEGFASDMHAEAAYRAHLVTVMAARAVGDALAPS
jgi:carbon-monoxide dehydrogenase medium subunit